MPPSPAMRISPRRELRAENHKRGRSLESGFMYGEKDDDLALFNEVQNKEKENFLLQSNDDFEDVFLTKLRYFSDQKGGISIPARGESSDLLNAEGDKNDYEWLITPPETPLFPSLDDDTPQANVVQRGRPRSQPVSMSRSSTMEKSYRSSRGSMSPIRLSLSPQSGNSLPQSRNRLSPEPHISPPRLKHSAPVRRPSPPPRKLSAASIRSSSPNPRRMSTGSAGAGAGAAAPRVKGTSPVRTSRGNSASPKIRAWQSNIPGFSSEAPPNLRTSLADRPASYVRGSSPASRNGSRSGRESMSPTATRRVSSPYTPDRDLYSSHSKGSMASSGDDDRESLRSIPVSSSDCSAPRSMGAIPNNRAPGYSKKPTKVLSSSAPKRSFDLALRQMDHRKGPQSMFRPLMSSVPSSTFYAGKASASHRSLISRNSSITTSSNASSDQWTSGAHDTEESEQNQDDVTSECVKGQYPEVHEEIFALDQVDCLNEGEGLGKKIHEGSPSSRYDDFTDNSLIEPQFVVGESSSQLDTTVDVATSSVVSDRKADYSDDDGGLVDMEICSNCGRKFDSMEMLLVGELKFCEECRSLEEPSNLTTVPTMVIAGESVLGDSTKILQHASLEALEGSAQISEPLQVISEAGDGHCDEISDKGQHCSLKFSPDISHELLAAEDVELNAFEKQVMCLPSDGDTGDRQLEHVKDYPNSKVDITEGAGISVLFKRSSSGKGRIVQSKSFSAANINYDDFSRVTDRIDSMRSSFGHGSTSVSSSVDLGSSRQIETRIQRQLSSNKSDIENYRYISPTKHKRSMSSLSGASSHALKVPSITANSHEDSFEVVSVNEEKDVRDAACRGPHDQSLASEFAEKDCSSANVESDKNLVTDSELSGHVMNIHLGDTLSVSVSEFEWPASHEEAENMSKNSSNTMNIDASSTLPESSTPEEDATPNLHTDWVDVEDLPNWSSVDAISEIEMKNDDAGSLDSQSDIDSTDPKNNVNELQDSSTAAASSYVRTASDKESDPSDNAPIIAEESTVMLGDRGRTKARSLTLEEATDTILFCSSIVHNLAYEAANIAIEKENSAPVVALQPTVTFFGKSNVDRRDIRSRTTGRRTSKSQKARQKKLETDKKHSVENNTESDENTHVANIVGVPNKGGDSTKPPKLESKCNCTIM